MRTIVCYSYYYFQKILGWLLRLSEFSSLSFSTWLSMMYCISSIEQLDAVPRDFSLRIGKLCCCKTSSQCFLPWTCGQLWGEKKRRWGSACWTQAFLWAISQGNPVGEGVWEGRNQHRSSASAARQWMSQEQTETHAWQILRKLAIFRE